MSCKGSANLGAAQWALGVTGLEKGSDAQCLDKAHRKSLKAQKCVSHSMFSQGNQGNHVEDVSKQDRQATSARNKATQCINLNSTPTTLALRFRQAVATQRMTPMATAPRTGPTAWTCIGHTPQNTEGADACIATQGDTWAALKKKKSVIQWGEKSTLLWQKGVGFGKASDFWHPYFIVHPPKMSNNVSLDFLTLTKIRSLDRPLAVPLA